MEITRTRCKASPAQLCHLAEYMKSHPKVASGLCQNLQGRAALEKSWQHLATELNSMGGAVKPMAKWKQAWRDMRNNVKKKAVHNHEMRGYGSDGTGNGLSRTIELTDVEEQVLSIVGPVAVYGMDDIMSSEPTLHTQATQPSQSPAPDTPPLIEPEVEIAPLPVLPEPLNRRKRKRILPRRDNFVTKLLLIEEKKLKIAEERNSLKKEKNEILNRLVSVLEEFSNKIKRE